jgi:small-conductance mechanosensitive channel/CRP-like cAMP-binding protein
VPDAPGQCSPTVPTYAALMAELREDHAAWVVGALLLTALVADRHAPDTRRRLRTITSFTALHLLLVGTAAAMRSADAPAWRGVHFAAQAAAAVAGVGSVISLVFAGILPRTGLHPPRILGDLVGAEALVILLLSIASMAGVDLSGVVATSAVLTAVIGLSLQDTLGNLIGGLALQLDKSMNVGDWVKVGDIVGRVTDIGWRGTAIETRNWETVLIPNGQLAKTQVLVLGRRTGQPVQWRRWVWFNVDFRYPPQRVLEVVTDALRSGPIPRVASDPPPNCVLMEYGESYARYAVRYWLTDLAVDDPTDSEVRVRIYNALRRQNMRLALPGAARILIPHNDRREEDQRSDQEARLAAVSRTELFGHLPEEDRRELAAGLRPAPFGGGEVITRQGNEAHWLYLLDAGEVVVRVAAEGGLEREVARLGPGSFFGEMSLMTGERRAATVTALTAVMCYRLDRSVFETVLRRRPELADEVAGVLARRRAQLAGVREDLDQEAQARRLVESEVAIGRRIREFFGLDEN